MSEIRTIQPTILEIPGAKLNGGKKTSGKTFSKSCFFSTLEDKFRFSARPSNILYICKRELAKLSSLSWRHFREDSRCFKNLIPASFRTDLSMVPWHPIKQEHNPDIALDIIMLWIYLIYYILMISLHVICFQNPECNCADDKTMILPFLHLRKTHVSLK